MHIWALIHCHLYGPSSWPTYISKHDSKGLLLFLYLAVCQATWPCPPLPCCQLSFLKMWQELPPAQLPSFPFQIKRRKMGKYLFVCPFHIQFPVIYSVFWLISQDALLRQRKFSSFPISSILKWFLTALGWMNSPSGSWVDLHSWISSFISIY